MRGFVLGAGTLGVLLSASGQVVDDGSVDRTAFARGIIVHEAAIDRPMVRGPSSAELDDVIDEYCVRCHNARRLTGNLSLEDYSVEAAADRGEVSEKMIGKLRLGMMPPIGARRPPADTLIALAETLEARMDAAAVDAPRAARRGFQRLNRAEYTHSIQDLLGLQVEAGAYLPPDTRSDNFDNIADVQMPSATVMDAYLTAADEISRMALGDPNATSTQATYAVPRAVSQAIHIEGTPRGTRGGLSALHAFPADGEYLFKASYYTTLTGTFFGRTARDEYLEISIDGERRATIEVDRFILQSDPTAEWQQTEPVFVTAGQHRVAAAFVRTFDGPAEEIVSPIRESLADLQVGYADGLTTLPHLWELVIEGPSKITGVSENATRRGIFTCRPTSRVGEEPCARQIVERLAANAYRRPLTGDDIELLMSFYSYGSEEGGFEVGVRTALQAILSSPDFIFRMETASPIGGDRALYRIDGPALASRLSYFLWGAPPDGELLEVAIATGLDDDEVLERQVLRMLADPRAEAFGERFAAQWLRLQDLDKVYPDSDMWPDFEETLRDAMRRETELFFNHIVAEDRSALELLTADYTFVDEALAEHYDIPNVAGENFRLVQIPNPQRRGLLGQGSVLVSTSHADRTSAVLRGKWIMEVFLDNPPPPPPPNVPELEATEGVEDGRTITLKERMEAHRANPACNSCHILIDPIGLALENFDVTGEWRIKDAGNPVDAGGELWDGSFVNGASDLRAALVRKRIPFLRAFTKNMMAYALGRRVEYSDHPAVRAITRAAEENDYRMSAFILGVVKSDQFRLRPAFDVASDGPQQGGYE